MNARGRWIFKYTALQLLNIIFSFSSVLTKFASLSIRKNGVLHLVTAGMVCAYIMLLIIYAFFWQKLLKCIPLSTAYLSKGLLLFWLLLWAFLIFNEKITLLNIIGVGIIFSGTLLVNTDG